MKMSSLEMSRRVRYGVYWKLTAGIIVVCILLAPGILMLWGCSVTKSASAEKLEVVDVNEPFELPQLLSGTGGASVKQAIVDPDGGTHELLATFDDPAAAMRSVTSDTGRVLDLLQGSFGLPALDGSSWSRYKWAMYAEFGRDDCPDWYGDGDPQFDKLRAFFDIYENDEENDEILKVASTQGFEAAEPMLPDR